MKSWAKPGKAEHFSVRKGEVVTADFLAEARRLDTEARANRSDNRMGEKSYYYNAEGEQFGPLPSDGKWVSTYNAKGLFLEPPHERLKLLCVIEDCEHEGEGNGFATEAELVTHARDAHGMVPFRNMANGEIVFGEDVEGEEPAADSSDSGADGGAGSEGNS